MNDSINENNLFKRLFCRLINIQQIHLHSCLIVPSVAHKYSDKHWTLYCREIACCQMLLCNMNLYFIHLFPNCHGESFLRAGPVASVRPLLLCFSHGTDGWIV